MTQYSHYIARKEARGIIAKLDAATHTLHDSIDENSQHLFSKEMTLHNYRKLLERYYSFYLPFEQRYDAVEQMSVWQEVGLDLARRKRIPLLKTSWQWEQPKRKSIILPCLREPSASSLLSHRLSARSMPSRDRRRENSWWPQCLSRFSISMQNTGSLSSMVMVPRRQR